MRQHIKSFIFFISQIRSAAFTIAFLAVAGGSTLLFATEQADIEVQTTSQSRVVYSVDIDPSTITGRINEPVKIELTLSPYPPPDGGFYTLVADFIEKPDGGKPKLLPSDRDIQVWCPIPGTYLLRIRVNKIAKSSCAGAQADIIAEKEVRLIIEN